MLKSLLLPKGAREELGIQGEGGMPAPTEEPAKKDNQEDSDNEEQIAERVRKAEETKMVYKLFKEGRYHLIPGFFRTLMFLKKQKKEFSVVFRTFGVDLPEVVFEFDKFCRGEHPCFNGRNNTPLVKLDGNKNSKDFRFQSPETQQCAMYRLGESINETVLIQGPHARVEGAEGINMF